MTMAAKSPPEEPLHTHHCPECGVSLGTGYTYDGKKVVVDLKVRVYALIGGRNPREIVRTHMAQALHSDVCRGNRK